MRQNDSKLKKVLGELSLDQRIETWMRAMHKAGGLNFVAASDEIRQEIFDLEHTTPEDGRDLFRKHRDRILGMNALLGWSISVGWLRAEAMIARMASLLSLMFVANTDGPRRILQQAR